MILLVILLFWGIALHATMSRDRSRLIYLFFVSLSFGSFAVVPTALTGGLTFTPTPIVALLILARCLMARGGTDRLLTVACSGRRMLALTLFWLVSFLVTLFMPRIMAGRVTIIPFRGEMLGEMPLFPTLQNVSQFAYLTISILLSIALAVFLRPVPMRRHCARALCLGSAVAILTGALDFASSYVPIKPLLEPFRTATYALLVSHEVLGTKRIVGLMPEASAYGTLCVGLISLLYFSRHAITDAWFRDRATPALLLGLLVATWLSTSTTAYVALGLLVCLAGLEWVWRATTAHRHSLARKGLALELGLAVAGMALVCGTLLAAPHLFDPLFRMFDRIVVQKSSSSSFHERGLWTAVSWNAMVDTGGIGVGVGSTRASNSIVGVISSTGVAGGLLYFGFIAQTLLRSTSKSDPEAALLLSAMRWSFLPIFATGVMIGISADFGPFLAYLYGVSAATAAMGSIGRRVAA